MKTKKKELITVRSYSKRIGKTTTWVYKLIENKSIKSEVIDGVIFVVVK